MSTLSKTAPGTPGKTTFDFAPYTGIHAKLKDPALAAVLLENSTISRNVYREGTVDHVFFDQAVVLTEDTAEALYSCFTPLEQAYAPGSRPFLEKVAHHVTASCKSDREKAIALTAWVRDLSILYPHPEGDPFHGGAEEEVIRKGSDMCNEMARVLGILCQIVGIPSRYIGHMCLINYDNEKSGTGHGINEMYIDGAWAYFDIRGIFFQKSDGSLASTWDIIRNPELMKDQPQEITRYRRSPEFAMDSCNRYFAPTSVHIIINYLAADHNKYDYSWVYPSRVRWLEAREKGRALRTTVHKDILPQPRPRIV